MNEAQKKFEEWFINSFKGGFPTKSLDGKTYSSIRTNNLWQAWQHQQQRIETHISINKSLLMQRDELEKKLDIACDDINRLHHRLMVNDRGYPHSNLYLEHQKAREQIEATE